MLFLQHIIKQLLISSASPLTMSDLFQKLLCIHRFSLPDDIRETMCEYAFQSMMERARQVRTQVNQLVIQSGKQKYYDETEGWLFCTNTMRVLSGNNCARCGGYYSRLIRVNKCVACTCSNHQYEHEHEYDDDHEYEDDEDMYRDTREEMDEY